MEIKKKLGLMSKWTNGQFCFLHWPQVLDAFKKKKKEKKNKKNKKKKKS